MSHRRRKVTLDTSAIDDLLSVKNHAARLGYEVQVVSTTLGEVDGTSFQNSAECIPRVLEVAQWGEARWGQAVWSGPDNRRVIKTALDIIASGGFPKNRAELTENQKRQLRDARIIEAHVRSGATLFVTNDKRGFVSHGRREAFQKQLGVQILLAPEFLKTE